MAARWKHSARGDHKGRPRFEKGHGKEQKVSSSSFESGNSMQLKLNAVLDASHDGLWIIDKHGIVLNVNKAAIEINGLKGIDVIGKDIRELDQAGVFNHQKLVSLDVIEKKKPCTVMQNLHNKVRTLVTGTPFFDVNGELMFVVINDRNISHLNMLYSTLEVRRLLSNFECSYDNLESEFVDLSDIIYESTSMRNVVDMAIRLSKVDSTVLIFGETGVGKNLVAKFVHNCSKRGRMPFVSINCAGIPDPLIESELFGYEYGAFTGSRSSGKKGLAELANGGCLFLDEIGDFSLLGQAKVLKFLENREIVRLGGGTSKKIDVRIIAATNKNLKDMISRGLFRQDLYYRLNVTSLFVPPLRERKTDIPVLAKFFVNKINKKYQLNKEISEEVLDFLTHFPYPGNVRELENLIEHVTVTGKGGTIHISDFPLTVLESSPPHGEKSLKDAVLDFEMKIIRAAINQYGSQKKAAKALGMDQSTLFRKMRRYDEFLGRIFHRNGASNVSP